MTMYETGIPYQVQGDPLLIQLPANTAGRAMEVDLDPCYPHGRPERRA